MNLIEILIGPPPYQTEEDRIVGAMVRKLRALTGAKYTEETCALMRAICLEAIYEAERVGARPEYVNGVARCCSVETGYGLYARRAPVMP